MGEKRSKAAKATRVRRARRQDIAVLAEYVGGPPARRVRALRRLLATLAADVYVVDRGGTVTALLAVHYRRSLAHGGPLATIDAMRTIGSIDETDREDLALLVECALTRAKRRGCVAIDSSVNGAAVRETLRENGFEPGPERLGRPLETEEDEG